MIMKRGAAVFAALVSAQLALLHVEDVQAEFYVCPAPCHAMMLPRDMESLEDCLCSEGKDMVDNYRAKTSLQKGRASLFTCPEGSTPSVHTPMSFADCECEEGLTRDDMHKQCTTEPLQCTGRYRLKAGVDAPESIDDCECTHPYRKDEKTGRCMLTHCPRAGNYIKKKYHKHIKSLADCTCLKPYVKNEQSGDCVPDNTYKCPNFATSLPHVHPKSFQDCICDIGFIATSDERCVPEVAHYMCPPNSFKRHSLPQRQLPRSFVDCVCVAEGVRYRRDEESESCVRLKHKKYEDRFDATDGEDETVEDEEEVVKDFTCPVFSIPLAPFPHSADQCGCLPGYEMKRPEMVCVHTSAFACPAHAYMRELDKSTEESFADCECARGYYRDESAKACLEWFLTNDNGCPSYAFLKHWPLQSKSNCQCVYGLNSTASDENAAIREGNKNNRRQSKLKPQCNRPPQHLLSSPDATFAQCPEHSFATNWPIASVIDCTCDKGYDATLDSDEELQAGDGIGFRCLPITEKEKEQDEGEVQTNDCRAPYRLSKYQGQCRLPVEQVQPPTRDTNTVTGDGYVVFKGIEYDYVLIEDNVMIVQGDIAIGELKVWDETKIASENKHPGKPYSYVLHGYYNSERDHRWGNGEMCYEIHMGAAMFERTVREATKHISDVTGFQFKACKENDCSEDKECAHDFVSIKSTASSCWSYVGRIGGKQSLGLSSDCGHGNVVHVLLHAMGLHHTIDRVDRDEHIRIAWECIPESKRSYFVAEDVNNTKNADVPYDYFSIMHHPSHAFVHSEDADATNKKPSWCQSVFPIIGDPDERFRVLSVMGQREKLSTTDIHAVWRLYPSLQAKATSGDHDTYMEKLGDAIYESRLHTQKDVIAADRPLFEDIESHSSTASIGRKLTSSIGALVTLCGFFSFVAFAFIEFQKRNLRGKDNFYSESLLQDKDSYD